MELSIAKDAVIVVQSRASDGPGCLTLADLYALTGPESSGFESYADADLLAGQIGPGGSLPNEQFELVTPTSSSGTVQTYIQDVIAGPAAQRNQNASVRRDHVTAATDQIVAEDVRQDPVTLGILGLTAAEAQIHSLRLVSIDSGRGCVKPTSGSIASGSYPLSRSLYVYVNLDRAAASPTVQSFVNLLVSPTSLAAVGAVGAIPLTAGAAARTAARWSAR